MNFCRHCGAAVEGHNLAACPRCQRPLQDSEETLVTLKGSPVLQPLLNTPLPLSQPVAETPLPVVQSLPDVPQLAAQPVAETPLPASEPWQQSLAYYATQLEIQQHKLLQLRQEMQERLERQRLTLEQQLAYQQQQMSAELAKKEEKKEEKDTRSEESQLTLWQKGGIIVFLILGGLACVANLVLILFYSTPAHRDNSLAVEGAALLIFGGFYLAYDLLGGRNGPLVRFTAYVTYALIGALGASIASVLLLAQDLTIIPLATRFKNFDIDSARTAGLSSTNLIIDTHSALFCLFWGAIIGISGKLLLRRSVLSQSDNLYQRVSHNRDTSMY